MTELQLVSTDELVRELKGRFDSIIIFGVQETSELSHDMTKSCEGNKIYCIGLANLLKDFIKDEYYELETADDEEKDC